MQSEENAKSLGDPPGARLGPPEISASSRHPVEMIALSFQTNRTRVATLKMVEEASMRTYPNLDVHEAFHPTSHWGGFPDRIANLRKIQNYHTAVFAKFVKRLADMREGNKSVLDDSIILFGSNMANSDAHNNDPLPQALIGRGGGSRASAPALPAGPPTELGAMPIAPASRLPLRESPTPAGSRRCVVSGLILAIAAHLCSRRGTNTDAKPALQTAAAQATVGRFRRALAPASRICQRDPNKRMDDARRR